jgi:SAM-dependent methyltransferase
MVPALASAMHVIDKPRDGDYRASIYSRYASAFKARGGGRPDYAFSDRKLVPILGAWVSCIPRDGVCLDLGCGSGNVLHALRTLGFQHLEGVDVSAEQVAIARAEFPGVEHKDITGKLRSAAPNAYNLITLFDVIEHQSKPEILEIFGLLGPCLARRGVLIVHCPNGESPFVGPVQHGDLTHETMLTPASAEHLCALFGFTGFEAKEPRNTSSSARGACRWLAWRGLRSVIRLCHLIETGNAGSGIVSRNFIFKAEKGWQPGAAPP